MAQWGFLGDGGEWAAVPGFDGTMSSQEELISPAPFRRVTSDMMDENIPPPRKPQLPSVPPVSRVSNLPDQQVSSNSMYYTSLSVKNYHDGNIVVDDPSLVAWSIDAFSLIRRQLNRASQGRVLLPCTENWSGINKHVGASFEEDDNSASESTLPKWADSKLNQSVFISDLPLLVSEVKELLDAIHPIMGMQRDRRMEKLKQPNWLRRNWYLGACAAPPLTFLIYRMRRDGAGWTFLKYTTQKLVNFFTEHVVEPVLAM